MKLLGWAIGHSADAGALPTLMASKLPGAKGGQLFGPQGWMEIKGPPGPGKIAPKDFDGGACTNMWAEADRLTGVRFGFRVGRPGQDHDSGVEGTQSERE